MKRFKKLTNKFPLKTFTIGLLTAVTVLHLFEKRYKRLCQLRGGGHSLAHSPTLPCPC
jgi:hypothetical protein